VAVRVRGAVGWRWAGATHHLFEQLRLGHKARRGRHGVVHKGQAVWRGAHGVAARAHHGQGALKVGLCANGTPHAIRGAARVLLRRCAAGQLALQAHKRGHSRLQQGLEEGHNLGRAGARVGALQQKVTDNLQRGVAGARSGVVGVSRLGGKRCLLTCQGSHAKRTMLLQPGPFMLSMR